MQVRVKNTTAELSIIIISDDVEFASQITKQADLAAYNAISAVSFDNAAHLLQRARPQVIIAVDNNDSSLNLFHDLANLEITSRPILIAVSDIPSSDLFSVSDQVIPMGYLSSIGQIITGHLQRRQQALSQENRCTELASYNHQLNQELAVAKQTRAEINLLKQAIVHSVSHELRTPMLQVKSAVALLNEDEHINRKIADLAMEATTRLEGGIRNVTLLNELMNESSDIHSFSAVPMVQIVQAATRNLGKSWEHKKDIERVEITSTDKAINALCDKQRLTIAVQLLLDNALKFSQDKVTVVISSKAKHVSVSIRDRGIGIPEDQLTQIFEPFYQIDGSSTRRFGGMGIGLAIVRLILDHHYASIRIESKQGKGTTFTFDLPVSET